MRRAFIPLLCAGLLFLSACGSQTKESSEESDIRMSHGTTIGPLLLTGESTLGMGGKEHPLKVEILFYEDKITEITVVEHGETPEIADPAMKQLIQTLIGKESTEGVDVVSGATLTSKALLDAVDQALSSR